MIELPKHGTLTRSMLGSTVPEWATNRSPFGIVAPVRSAIDKSKIKFSTSSLADPHIQQVLKYISAETGHSVQTLENSIKDEMAKFHVNYSKAPLLYGTILENFVENEAFALFAKTKVGIVHTAPKFTPSVFSLLRRKLKAEHSRTMFPLKNKIDRLPLANEEYVLVPSSRPQDKQYDSIKIAAATPGGTFIFNVPYCQKLLEFAHIKGVLPKGKKYKNNGGTFDPEWCYVEFLLLHEWMHYTQADWHYQKIFKETGEVSNWVGDFRSNYELVKGGLPQLPVGLYSRDINYDTQATMRDMYDVVRSEMNNLTKQEQEQIKKQMDKNTDDHHKNDGQKEEADSQDSGKEDSDNNGEPNKEQEKKEGKKGQDGKESKKKEQQDIGEGEKEDKGEGQEQKEGEGESKPGEGGKGGGGKDGEGKGKGNGKGGAGGQESKEEKEEKEGHGKGKRESEKEAEREKESDEEFGEKPLKPTEEEMEEAARKAREHIQEGLEKAEERNVDPNAESEEAKRAREEAERLARQGREVKHSKVDYSKEKPTFNWEQLLKEFVKNSVSGTEETYAKLNRRDLPQMTDQLEREGTARIKPAEVDTEGKIKLCVVIDSSASMMYVLGKIYANLGALLNKNKQNSVGDKFYVLRFSDHHECFLVSLKTGVAKEVDPVRLTLLPGKPSVTLNWLFSTAESGGTEFTKGVVDSINSLIRDKNSVLIVTDSDCLYGDNFTNFSNTMRNNLTSVYAILSDRWTYEQARGLLKIKPKNLSYFA